MKKNAFCLLLLLTALQIVSCNNIGNKCMIIGTISDSLAVPDDAKVILSLYNEKIDETEIVDRTFSFELTADNTKAFALFMSDNGQTPIDKAFTVHGVLEKGKIFVNLGENTVIGGKINESLKDLQSTLPEIFYKDRDAIETAWLSGDMATYDSLSQIRDNAMIALCEDAYRENPDNPVGLQALSTLIRIKGDTMSVDELNDLLSMGGGDIIKYDKGTQKNISYIIAADALRNSDKVPDILGKDKAGTEQSLYSLMDGSSYVLLDFWASWCGSCSDAIPVIKELIQKYANTGLSIIGVNCWEEDIQDALDTIESESIIWPVIMASDDEVDKFGVSAIPTFILISPEGKMLERCVGTDDLAGMLAPYFN